MIIHEVRQCYHVAHALPAATIRAPDQLGSTAEVRRTAKFAGFISRLPTNQQWASRLNDPATRPTKHSHPLQTQEPARIH